MEAAGEFLSISDIARRLNITVGPVSRQVAKLEARGAIATRMEGSKKLVDFDAYMATKRRTEDAVRAENGRKARREPDDPAPDLFSGGNAGSGGSDLASQQARKTRAQADLAELQLQKARGLVVDLAAVEDAMARAGGRLARGLDALPGRADELAAVVARDGSAGLRGALKAVVRELRERLAADMTADGGAGGDD